MVGFCDFASRHWVIMGIIVSLLWFRAGRDDRNSDSAVLWQCGAVFFALILCGWAVAKGEWLGLACGLLVVCFEIRSIRRILASQSQQRK